ncbi:LOW QUALITY PROTEIN: hypothetical protein Cgig2_014007 [Carnegiea gigantea]|uniref:Leucine-rich repeat-containing N-terminal plant-type domain-containing protein n=1 Tax=Carnegiea gigantea TaxID=171969 RepID=A0A9Q1KWM4_9CARY|nr:LOW QUALITY PROTEIN: hypothetical protein Cgig2_014007 [Carnegiea gigantea]
MHTGEAHLSPPCLTPNHDRGKVVFVLIIMFVLPVVSYAGIVSGTSGNKTDHLGLLAIKSAIKDPLGALTSWNHCRDHCHWEGIICGHRHRRVVALNVSYYITIHWESQLSSLNLSFYQQTSQIPHEIGFHSRLSFIYLFRNLLIGEIPSSISNCLSLQCLSIGENSLAGRIPPESSSLSMLKKLFADKNNFSGPVISTIQNLTSLEELSAENNAFEGIIPDTIGQMKNLPYLAVGSNHLTGSNYFGGVLPRSVANLSAKLIALELHVNMTSGRIPPGISHLTSLIHLVLHKNQLSGTIPSEIGKASKARNY